MRLLFVLVIGVLVVAAPTNVHHSSACQPVVFKLHIQTAKRKPAGVLRRGQVDTAGCSIAICTAQETAISTKQVHLVAKTFEKLVKMEPDLRFAEIPVERSLV